MSPKKKKIQGRIKAEIWQMLDGADSYSMIDHVSKKYYFILAFKKA